MARRAALVLTPRLPWPLDDGGRIVSWQSVWSAAQTHDVTLISFVPPGSEAGPIPPAVTDLGIAVVRVPHRPPPLALAAVAGLFGRLPYTLTRYRSGRFAAAVRERIAVLAPAYVLANHLHMAPYVEVLDGTPMVLRQHNVEHTWMERYARVQGASPAGIYAGLQAWRLKRAEAHLCRAAALTLAIQELETEVLRALVPGARVETLPVGIDTERFPTPSPIDPPTILLAASFEWPPNVDGALRFLAEGWPRVRTGAPGTRLRIAGKNPPPKLRDAARHAGAEVVGFVPSMAEEFKTATLLIVPLWIGAGARVKIIEALAARLPVVSTSVAAEGLGLIVGRHFLEGETATDLGAKALLLLREPALREALVSAGRRIAEERWALPAVARLQNDLVSQVAR